MFSRLMKLFKKEPETRISWVEIKVSGQVILSTVDTALFMIADLRHDGKIIETEHCKVRLSNDRYDRSLIIELASDKVIYAMPKLSQLGQTDGRGDTL